MMFIPKRKRADLDAVLHLGDYIYEYANRGFGDGERLGRIPFPARKS
jgi:alkaline phosphatase D